MWNSEGREGCVGKQWEVRSVRSWRCRCGVAFASGLWNFEPVDRALLATCDGIIVVLVALKRLAPLCKSILLIIEMFKELIVLEW